MAARRASRFAGRGPRKRDVDLAPIIADLRTSGASTLTALAAGLNARDIPTAREGRWSPTQVKRVLERAP